MTLSLNISGFQPEHRTSDADRAAIVALVQQILDLKSADPEADVSALEAEINAIVKRLYFGDRAE